MKKIVYRFVISFFVVVFVFSLTGCANTQRKQQKIIDTFSSFENSENYIFVTKDLISTKYYSAIDNVKNGKYPSDHLPVLAEIEI